MAVLAQDNIACPKCGSSSTNYKNVRCSEGCPGWVVSYVCVSCKHQWHNSVVDTDPVVHSGLGRKIEIRPDTESQDLYKILADILPVETMRSLASLIAHEAPGPMTRNEIADAMGLPDSYALKSQAKHEAIIKPNGLGFAAFGKSTNANKAPTIEGRFLGWKKTKERAQTVGGLWLMRMQKDPSGSCKGGRCRYGCNEWSKCLLGESLPAKFNVGDKVMIARQPKNQYVQLVGEIVVIAEIFEEHASVAGNSGVGTIPLSSLDRIGPDQD